MLDKLDQKLVRELQKNGRRNYTELAKMLGVSEGTIRNRVRTLEKRGLLKITAVLNLEELGYKFINIIGMQVTVADLQRLGETLAQKSNVYYVSFVIGRYDLLIITMFRTSQELSDFLKYISSIPSIIRTETFLNLEIIKKPWAEPGILSTPPLA